MMPRSRRVSAGTSVQCAGALPGYLALLHSRIWCDEKQHTALACASGSHLWHTELTGQTCLDRLPYTLHIPNFSNRHRCMITSSPLRRTRGGRPSATRGTAHNSSFNNPSERDDDAKEMEVGGGPSSLAFTHPARVGTPSVQLVPQPDVIERLPHLGCITYPGLAVETRSAWQFAITEMLTRSPDPTGMPEEHPVLGAMQAVHGKGPTSAL
mmetsp:Transcript_36481/g.86372  ORF Transcript_36481/g.86372 Transcript_36481/m.86372 type:complete len:211 (-) Transcript_36481:577-1209(-)